MSSHSDTKLPSDEILQDGWSCLKYIELGVEGLPDTVIALNDSGCQLCVVRADTVRPLNLPTLAQTKLTDLFGESLLADIVRIRVRLTMGKEFVNIVCAVIEKLDYGLLGSDIIYKLNQNFMNENFDANEMMNVVRDANDNDDVDENEVTNDKCDNGESENDENINMSDPRMVSAEILISEQRSSKVTDSKVPVDFQDREKSELVSLIKYCTQVKEIMCDTVTTGHEQTKINHCAVIYDDDSDLGSVDTIYTDQFQQPELLPSQRIYLKTLTHLSVEQRTKL